MPYVTTCLEMIFFAFLDSYEPGQVCTSKILVVFHRSSKLFSHLLQKNELKHTHCCT